MPPCSGSAPAAACFDLDAAASRSRRPGISSAPAIVTSDWPALGIPGCSTARANTPGENASHTLSASTFAVAADAEPGAFAFALDSRTSLVHALSGPWECPSPRRPSLGRESRASFRGAFTFRRLFLILSHLHARKRPQTPQSGRRDGAVIRWDVQAPKARCKETGPRRGEGTLSGSLALARPQAGSPRRARRKRGGNVSHGLLLTSIPLAILASVEVRRYRHVAIPLAPSS